MRPVIVPLWEVMVVEIRSVYADQRACCCTAPMESREWAKGVRTSGGWHAHAG